MTDASNCRGRMDDNFLFSKKNILKIKNFENRRKIIKDFEK